MDLDTRKNETVAVVVTYNRKDLLRRNLTCLLGQEGASCDVLLVDNASTDGTREMVESEFDDPRVTYFNTGANLGGAGGFHVGLYGAVTLGYKYAWIMDDDSLPSPTALSELLRAGEALGDWGFLSSAVYWTDGSLCEANRPKKDLFRHIGDDDLGGGPRRVLMGSFVSMLVPTAVVREVGLPIAEYFIWTDDYEFSGRISRLHPCYFVPGSEVTHAMASNSRADIVTAEGERARRFRMLYRNDVHCYRQHGLPGMAYLAAKGAYTAADVLLHADSGKADKLGTICEGYREGMSFGPRVVRPRRPGDRKRVLFYTDGWDRGGIEVFVMNLLRRMDMSEYEVSVFSPWDTGRDCFGDELRELGVRRYTLESGERPSNVKRGILDLKPFAEMFDFGSIDVFHAHSTTVVGLAYCYAAKKAGARLVIAHSHGALFGDGNRILKSAAHEAAKIKFGSSVDVRLACSKAAGEYLFGRHPFEVVNNGIDTKLFAFDKNRRASVRAELGLSSDDVVVGNVGRIADEKNPLFQVDVFAALHLARPDIKFLMVGSGPQDDEVQERIAQHGLSDHVLRVPLTPNPDSYYSALDAFVFPSKFEGLGITAIEAQCSGLPVVAAAHLPEELKVTDLVRFVDLDAGAKEWADVIQELLSSDVDRAKYSGVLESAGWTADACAKHVLANYQA